MNNSELIEEYKKFISFEKRLSSSSVKNYLRDINTLLKLNENVALDGYSIENIRKNMDLRKTLHLELKHLRVKKCFLRRYQ